MTAGQCFRFVYPKYLCILASCFQLGFSTTDLALGLCSLHLWKHWVGAKDFSTGVRIVLPVDFPVAMETNCVNRALLQSLQPPGM